MPGKHELCRRVTQNFAQRLQVGFLLWPAAEKFVEQIHHILEEEECSEKIFDTNKMIFIQIKCERGGIQPVPLCPSWRPLSGPHPHREGASCSPAVCLCVPVAALQHQTLTVSHPRSNQSSREQQVAPRDSSEAVASCVTFGKTFTVKYWLKLRGGK